MAKENPFEMGLRWFAGQSAEMRDRILTFLANSGPEISIGALAGKVAEATDSPRNHLEIWLESIASLVPVASGDQNFVSIVVDVSLRMVFGESATAEQHPELAKDLFRLLSLESSIGLTGKAQNIIWGHGKTFKDAHVVTQIRPIFLADLEAPVKSAVIVHELRVDHQEGEVSGSNYVVMDKEKIDKLIHVLQRALKKEAAIRQGKKLDFLS